ncbi:MULTISPECIES: hypothetical protein [Pseudomonas]|uniref:hypothetical protein n=1 Tax=Pseudomonas TaxID=286 RepID=UPI0015E3AC96|nr:MULTISPECIES: hypothetical protein [Pseudomonas]WLG48713.1 hypothetical protein PSH64_18445 [Pseudomonas sp. FP1742]
MFAHEGAGLITLYIVMASIALIVIAHGVHTHRQYRQKGMHDQSRSRSYDESKRVCD